MHKSKKILLVVLALIVAGLGLLWLTGKDNGKQDNTPVPTQSAPPTIPKVTISDDKKAVSYDGQTGKTALEVVKSLTAVETKTSSFGEYVESIDGIKAEEGKTYWAFYVNGAYANEGAGTYNSQDSDKIEWKLEDVQ